MVHFSCYSPENEEPEPCAAHVSELLSPAVAQQLTTFGVWFDGDVSNNAAR